MKPDSQKSYLEQAGDAIKGKTDVSASCGPNLTPQSAASTAQPESQKSYTQQAGDMLSGNKNDNQESLMDKAKNTFGSK